MSERDALVDTAIRLYKREQVSLGRAAEIAGLSSPEFPSDLDRCRIRINCDLTSLHADFAMTEALSSRGAH